MDLSDIKIVAILVEMENGNAHQVLTSKENKDILIRLLANMDGGTLRLSEEIMPVKFESKG